MGAGALLPSLVSAHHRAAAVKGPWRHGHGPWLRVDTGTMYNVWRLTTTQRRHIGIALATDMYVCSLVCMRREWAWAAPPMAGRASAKPADSASPMSMRASDAARKLFRIMLLTLVSSEMVGPERVVTELYW